MDFANLVSFSCVVQNSLSGGGLACIDVGHDTDIAVLVQTHRSSFSDLRDGFSGTTSLGECVTG